MCRVSVVPTTGKITVDKYTIAVDPGIVVNPQQLKRTIEGGALMGLSHALYEEMTFDESGVTSRDWRSYPILMMADVPEIEVVILNHPEVGAYGGGSEAANTLADFTDPKDDVASGPGGWRERPPRIEAARAWRELP